MTHIKTCDHKGSTIARLIELGLPCLNCGMRFEATPTETTRTEPAFTEIRASATPEAMPENECEHRNRTHWRHWHVGWIEKCLDCGRER